MRKTIVLLLMLLSPVVPATAQISIGIGLPHLSIGINLPVYPELEPVPGYPVYYAPQLDSNYFFYDGMYWVYQDDNWYASSWYNGPWSAVGPEYVPAFVLRIPVRYYRRPPGYFRGWQDDAPPRWGDHWGHDWSQRRNGWDHWNRNARRAPPPLPAYQRQYSGDRYPDAGQQRDLQRQNYRYQPRNSVVRQHYEALGVQGAPAAEERGSRGPGRSQDRQQGSPAAAAPAPEVSRPQPMQRRQEGQPRGRDNARQAAPPAATRNRPERVQAPQQPPQQAPRQAPQQRPQNQERPHGQNQNQHQHQNQNQNQNQNNGHDRGQGENRGNGRGEDRKD